jgi:hypothetical protein
MLAVLSGCYEPPFEPGSDLLPDVGPAVLSSAADGGLADASADEGADINGRFNISGSLPTPVGPEPVDVTFLVQAIQEGTLAGGATVDLWILDEDDPERTDPPPPSFEVPAPVDAQGAFEGTVIDLIIPQDFSDLLADDARADVRFQGQILDSDCFFGGFSLTLKEASLTVSDNPVTIPLENGIFQATRTGASCEFPTVEGGSE